MAWGSLPVPVLAVEPKRRAGPAWHSGESLSRVRVCRVRGGAGLSALLGWNQDLMKKQFILVIEKEDLDVFRLSRFWIGRTCFYFAEAAD